MHKKNHVCFYVCFGEVGIIKSLRRVVFPVTRYGHNGIFIEVELTFQLSNHLDNVNKS